MSPYDAVRRTESADTDGATQIVVCRSRASVHAVLGEPGVGVAQGAGSPAEINLRSSDYVNMGLARHADMPVVVVGDIDRGGVIAQIVGTQAVIMPGVTIGHGAIVGSYSIVTKDVPPYAIVAGNPAEVRKMRFDEATVAELLDIAWWDWPAEKVTRNLDALRAGDVAALRSAR